MLKSYIFKNTLRVRKNIDYKLTNNDILVSRYISTEPWVNLVNKYTLLNLTGYSINDMLKTYIDGKIKIKIVYPFIYHNYEDIGIYSRKSANQKFGREHIRNKIYSLLQKQDKSDQHNLFSLSILKDDYVYDQAQIWFITIKEKIVLIETNLCSKNKICSMSLYDWEVKDSFYAGLCFAKFCFEKLGFYEKYRILPKPKNGEYMISCIDGLIENEVPITPDGTKQINLGNDFIKYSRFNNKKENTLEKLKKCANYGS